MVAHMGQREECCFLSLLTSSTNNPDFFGRQHNSPFIQGSTPLPWERVVPLKIIQWKQTKSQKRIIHVPLKSASRWHPWTTSCFNASGQLSCAFFRSSLNTHITDTLNKHTTSCYLLSFKTLKRMCSAAIERNKERVQPSKFKAHYTNKINVKSSHNDGSLLQKKEKLTGICRMPIGHKGHSC